MSQQNGNSPEMVTVTIDGKQISVPKGMNLIEAARLAGVEVPHYCYHPNLSIAGNCRMCQVQIKGRPKLEIACNTTAADGMEIATHLSSKEVEDAQAATLEFILINHPLDCTVCDQAGHCKLQDYHYEYNARSSRFLEDKEHKVKAEPLGPTVVLDGERCIMCTRCVRFCDEVTGTSELGMLNRGDKSVIAVNNDRVLDNPLSGTVVDLCPVGALTHRKWRFNTRIWFTQQTDSICPGCSTGCNVKAATRDGEVVQVKARVNQAVNKEWLCDEGRYGFMRFLPKHRVIGARSEGREDTLDGIAATMKSLASGQTAIFTGTDHTTEEFLILRKLMDGPLKNAKLFLSYRERPLSKVESILISPDYAPNFRGAEITGAVSGDLQTSYEQALKDLAAGSYQNVLVIGDRGILPEDCSPGVLEAVSKSSFSAAILTDSMHPLANAVKALIGGRSILERSGVLVNRNYRAQYSDRILPPPDATEPAWRVLNALGKALGMQLVNGATDRDATLWLLGSEGRLKGSSIKSLKEMGVPAA